LRVKQGEYDAWVLDHRLLRVLALSELLHTNELKVHGPIRVELLLPLLKERLEHQDLIIALLSFRVDLRQLSISYVGIPLLGQLVGFLALVIAHLVVLSEVLLQVDTLLEPLVASPSHGYLVEVLKERNEPDEVGVL